MKEIGTGVQSIRYIPGLRSGEEDMDRDGPQPHEIQFPARPDQVHDKDETNHATII